MANRNLFSTAKKKAQSTNTMNEAGGTAYKMESRAALAQIATTGCLSSTYYASAKSQLDQVLKLAKEVAAQPEGDLFLAKLAIYSREKGFMKDMPALLLTILAIRSPLLYEKIFPRVVDNTKMLRNHVQILRSGQIDGRKAMPCAMRRQIKKWFANRSGNKLFRDSVGNDPSLVDVIKMVHPKPSNPEQNALFGYLLNRKFNDEFLPPLVKQYECFKQDKTLEVPDVPFQMLDSLGLNTKHWTSIAKNAKWQMTRMNLNTFQRHGVFSSKNMVKMIAERLKDAEQVKNAKAFPYQLMSAFMNSDSSIPFEIKDALQEAMEISTNNIPALEGNVYVFVDVSGSMSSVVTGVHGKKKASTVQCLDVAALIGAAIMRTNKQTVVVPFDTELHRHSLNSRDSIMTNATKLKSKYGGGTNCSLGVEWLAKEKKEVDLIIYVSDNESWVDTRYGSSNATKTLRYFKEIKKRNKNAKMVCIDLQPYTTTQAPDRKDILNVGGFSDQVFEVIAQFAKYGNNGEHWADFINKEVEL